MTITTRTASSLRLSLLALLLHATVACNAGAVSPQQGGANLPSNPPSHMRQSQPVSFTPSQPHQIEDQTYGVPFATLTLPAGWAYNGGVLHAETCAVSGTNPVISVQSPDGAYGEILAPHLQTIAGNLPNLQAQIKQGGCEMNASKNAADFVRTMFLPRLGLQNMRIVHVQQLEKASAAVQQLRQQAQQYDAMATNQFEQQRTIVDSTETRVTFDSHGQRLEGSATAITQCQQTRYQFPGQATMEQQSCTSFLVDFIFAPAGQLDSFASKTYETMKENPAWTRRNQEQLAQEHEQAMAQSRQVTANLKANGDAIMQRQNDQYNRGQQRIASQQQQFDQYNQMMRNKSNATHEVAQAAAAHNGDYNDYTNPQTGQTVRASNQYNNTYINSTGTVTLQTNQAGTPGVDWSIMVPRFR